MSKRPEGEGEDEEYIPPPVVVVGGGGGGNAGGQPEVSEFARDFYAVDDAAPNPALVGAAASPPYPGVSVGVVPTPPQDMISNPEELDLEEQLALQKSQRKGKMSAEGCIAICLTIACCCCFLN
jgi:hypothetical protein